MARRRARRRRRELPDAPPPPTTSADVPEIRAEDWLGPYAGLYDFPSFSPEDMVAHAQDHHPHLIVSAAEAEANAARRERIHGWPAR